MKKSISLTLLIMASVLSAAPPARAENKIVEFWKVVAGLRAKDFCSCYFVVQQSKEYCTHWIGHGVPVVNAPVPVFGVRIDKKNKAVHVNGATARWLSADEGCMLE